MNEKVTDRSDSTVKNPSEFRDESKGDVEISFYRNVRDQHGKKIKLSKFLDGIAKGTWSSLSSQVRKNKDKKERDTLKADILPGATISGLFSSRNNKNLLHHSGFICIDFDDIRNIKQVRDKLKTDCFTYAIFLSVSGRGLSVIVSINPNKHREAFLGLGKYYKDNYGIDIDKSCKDVARLRFVSFDPLLFVNSNAKLFEEYIKEKETKKNTTQKDKEPDPKLLAQVQSIVKQAIVKQVEEDKIVLGDDSYESWLDIGFSLADGLGEAGRKFFHQVSYSSPKYSKEECDKQYDECLSADEPEKKITINTFFRYAKEAGLEIANQDDRKIDILSSLESWEDIRNMDIEIEWLVDKLIPKDGITLIFGKGGIGKTWLSLRLASCIGNGEPFLGFKTIKTPVIYIDFENPEAVLHERLKKIGKTENVHFCRAYNVDYLVPKLDSNHWPEYKKLIVKGSVLIFDTLRAAQGGDENASNDMGLIMNRLKELRGMGFTIIILHHTPKSSDSVAKGSTAIVDLADHVLGLTGAPKDDNEYKCVSYRFGVKEKTRYEPNHVYLTFNPDKGFELATDPQKDSEEDNLIEMHKILKKYRSLSITKFIDECKVLKIPVRKLRQLVDKGEDEFWLVVPIGRKNKKIVVPSRTVFYS